MYNHMNLWIYKYTYNTNFKSWLMPAKTCSDSLVSMTAVTGWNASPCKHWSLRRLCSVFSKVFPLCSKSSLEWGCQTREGAEEDEVQKAPCENTAGVLGGLSQNCIDADNWLTVNPLTRTLCVGKASLRNGTKWTMRIWELTYPTRKSSWLISSSYRSDALTDL